MFCFYEFLRVNRECVIIEKSWIFSLPYISILGQVCVFSFKFDKSEGNHNLGQNYSLKINQFQKTLKSLDIN